MQVATDASALLLAKLDDALSRQLQLLGETDCVDGGGDLGCEVGDQAVVALPQTLACACCEPELAERDALVDEREREEVGARRCRIRRRSRLPVWRVVGECEPDVRQRERLADRLDDGREDGVELQRRRERSAEPGDRRVGIVPLAVHEPVDEPLHALPHRLEADGHDTGHDEREEKVAAGRERRADQSDDGDIAGDDADRHHAVDEGAVDDEVDLVEPVLEDGDGDSGRQEQKRQPSQERGARNNTPQQRADDDERHGEAERHSDPAQLLSLVAVGAAVPDDERHE